ncbi:MAG: hypothetical protein WAR57_13270, partial [Candidatus Phosphoribacter sp.]
MLKRAFAVIGTAIGLMVIGLSPVQAAGPVQCQPGQSPDPVTGICVLVVVAPPTSGGVGGDAAPVRAQAAVSAPEKCVWAPPRTNYFAEVPCSSPDGYYSHAFQCYISLLNPQPPMSDPVWQGHTDGAIYRCYPPVAYIAGPVFLPYTFWSPAAPSGLAAPDPRALAQRAVEQMGLRAVDIGIVPEARAGSVGVVGM